MPVEGPTGFRVIDWDASGKKLHSPSKSAYLWENRVQWAECDNYHSPHVGVSEVGVPGHPTMNPPYDPDEFPDWPSAILKMTRDCNAGIWASTDIEIIHRKYAKYQAGSVLCWVEALGSVYLYTHGWRASGIEILGIVWPQKLDKGILGDVSPTKLRYKSAAEKLGVRILPNEEVVIKAVEYSLEKYGGNKYEWSGSEKGEHWEPFQQ